MATLLENFFCTNWKSIVDSMTEGVMIVNQKGIILYANRALINMLQYRAEELIGKSCSILQCSACKDARKAVGGKHCSLFHDGEVKHRHCSFKRKDGTLVQVLKNATAMREENGRWSIGIENLTNISELISQKQEINKLKKQLDMDMKSSFHGIHGISSAMQKLFELIQSAAASSAPVTIYGESGTGKELVASALHHISSREKQPFIKVNCAALNENLLESELFGHVKGAFTGAENPRTGRFEAADRGSIFLDEIADMPLSIQAKLLRVLQEKEIERVGDHRVIKLDVRIITATHKNLEQLIGAENFREDLFYRINVIPIHLPPLRDRREDIPLICNSVIRKLRLRTSKEIEGLSASSLDLLQNYSWPGNVRELINALEYAFVTCSHGEIAPSHLPATLLHKSSAKTGLHLPPANHRRKPDREQIIRALQQSAGNRSEAARNLGVSRVTLWKWMNRFDIE